MYQELRPGFLKQCVLFAYFHTCVMLWQENYSQRVFIIGRKEKLSAKCLGESEKKNLERRNFSTVSLIFIIFFCKLPVNCLKLKRNKIKRLVNKKIPR